MSKKLFVVSDIHSFFSIFKNELDKKGFDPNNENHWLIVCGDCFDRGDESYELLKFLMNLERKILVKGNHDILLEECCMREYFYHHDIHNGTKKTIESIGGAEHGKPFDECCRNTWNKTATYRDSLVNYFETKNYIFVHGWIPCDVYSSNKMDRPWYQRKKIFEYRPDWRQCTNTEWDEAMWINGISLGRRGVLEPNKIIVCGHWHCSAGYHMDSDGEISEFGEDACWEPYGRTEGNTGFLAIDRCTAHTGECNIVVLEDEFLEG